jgi:hypothetical protein
MNNKIDEFEYADLVNDGKKAEAYDCPTLLKVESQSVPYIKLMKNTKGYNWEIKSLTNDIAEIEKINNQMLNKFGGEQNGI